MLPDWYMSLVCVLRVAVKVFRFSFAAIFSSLSLLHSVAAACIIPFFLVILAVLLCSKSVSIICSLMVLLIFVLALYWYIHIRLSPTFHISGNLPCHFLNVFYIRRSCGNLACCAHPTFAIASTCCWWLIVFTTPVIVLPYILKLSFYLLPSLQMFFFC